MFQALFPIFKDAFAAGKVSWPVLIILYLNIVCFLFAIVIMLVDILHK